MIKSISATNLKGLTFNHEIGAKTLIIGPNGSGKTAMNIAEQLVINGYVAADKPYKNNSDILANFGSENILRVGISNGKGILIARQWNRSEKGQVSQNYLINGRKATKDKYVAELVAMGSPKIFDVSEFMQLSDQKKIDLIFELFPPAGDIGKISDEIENLSEKLNLKRSKLRDKESFVAKPNWNFLPAPLLRYRKK
jgi:ABC-type cobalamin/Fe3+-siderophores transport system ATPase subunit